MRFYWLVLGVLCVWRVTHLLNAEDGPWRLVVRLRRFAGNGFWGELLDCFYCLSLWIAAPLAVSLGNSAKERALLWPALSAAAILLERLTAAKQDLPPVIVYEDQENHNVLRKQQTEHEETYDPDRQYAGPRDSHATGEQQTANKSAPGVHGGHSDSAL
jgi:hypothetical protein